MNNSYTEDISEFGHRELRMLADLLTAYCEQTDLPSRFYNSGVKPAMNKNSGYVFLVNEEDQVLMLNGSKLDIWHTLPYSGEEGFLEDFDTEADYHQSDAEYLQDWNLEICGEVLPD